MCGISGIVNRYKQQVEKIEIKKINDLISHRGPDDEGFYFGKNFALGHRRLSILDLSSDGHQPMHFLDKYVITYNGEIYNYLEIRSELLENGYLFESNTDTEVILASYDKWGEECVNRFNGMWAFSIFDKEKNILFCSRDRFGIKPFYYTEENNRFIFGSEIKQLLCFNDINYVNTIILVDYLQYGLEEHTNETFFKNIFKLEQSHNLIYDLTDYKLRIYKYFDLEFDKNLYTLSEEKSVEVLRKTIENSIELRLRSDVKVGTCLSGGLDSSTIAAIASKKYFEKTNEKFIAIHAKSIEEKTDESHFAKEVANYCNLDMIEVEPQLEDITNNIEEVIYTQEEPFGGPSVFMQYFVMKKARENGCIVMLDGQGGDETLFGYENYYSFYFASLLKKMRIIDYYQEMSNLKLFKLSKKQIIKDSVIVLFRNQLSTLKYFIKKEKNFIKVQHDRKRLDCFFELKSFKNFQKRELMSKNLPHLLRYEDKNSMRHSVESRLPFIDYKFVTSAVSTNDTFKFKNGYLKYLLRKTVEDILPDNIVWRTNKFGFEAPTDMWINTHRNEMIKKIFQSELLKNIIDFDEVDFKNTKILWKLYNISIWEKIFNVKFEKISKDRK